jgi:hypothetical protein
MSKKSKETAIDPNSPQNPASPPKKIVSTKKLKSIDGVAENPPKKYLIPYDKISKAREPLAPRIGEISETSLHASIKHILAMPGDQFEVKIDGKIVDLLRTNGEIVEVQTGNFGKLKSKVERLVPAHKIRIVYPIPIKKTIVQLDTVTGEELSRRKSPKKGNIYTVFHELVHFPALLTYPGICLEVLFVEIEELRVRDGRGSWRRRFQSILDKRLSGNEKSHVFTCAADILELVPKSIHSGFTASMLATESGIAIQIAREMAYVLKKMGLTKENGKVGREILYRVARKKRRANVSQA